MAYQHSIVDVIRHVQLVCVSVGLTNTLCSGNATWRENINFKCYLILNVAYLLHVPGLVF